jgi:hypothetical protein
MEFLVYFKLDFCRLHRQQKSSLKWTKNPVDFCNLIFQKSSTGGNNASRHEIMIFAKYKKQDYSF